MKKMLSLFILIVLLISLTSCCFTNKMEINGVVYETYGLLNKDERKDPSVEYKLSWGNIALGVIFCETIAAPIWFFGFDIWEPVGLKK